MKIKAIIFSKDQSKELGFLLNSINEKTQGVFDVNVLYNYSSEESKNEYEQLIEKLKSKINFIKETSFKETVMSLCDNSHKYICFLQSTNLFIDNLNVSLIEEKLENQDIFCFSTILGLNTTFCNREKTGSIIIPLQEDENTIVWDWTKHYLNYGNPFYVEGCIYRTKDISKLSKSIKFSSSEEYEQALLIYEDYPRNLMAAYKKNILKNTIYNEQ